MEIYKGLELYKMSFQTTKKQYKQEDIDEKAQRKTKRIIKNTSLTDYFNKFKQTENDSLSKNITQSPIKETINNTINITQSPIKETINNTIHLLKTNHKTIRKRCPRGTYNYEGKCLTKEEIQLIKTQPQHNISMEKRITIRKRCPHNTHNHKGVCLSEDEIKQIKIKKLNTLPTENVILPTENVILPTENVILPTENVILPTEKKLSEKHNKTIRKRCPRGTQNYKGKCLSKEEIAELKLNKIEELNLEKDTEIKDIIYVEPTPVVYEKQPEKIHSSILPIKTEITEELLEETLKEEKVQTKEVDKNENIPLKTAITPPEPPTPEEIENIQPKEGYENEYLLAKERDEYQENKINNSYDFLYPNVNDPNFAYKISKKKEFSDFQYDGSIKDIKKVSDKLCNALFELMPHQMFVKNFLSFQTPYNSLLLYHGLGSGKSLSAIGITEEMRDYLKQTGLMNKKIIIVATPNVQSNFRKELFNEKKLEEKDGLWLLNTVIGNKLLKEVNPTNIKGIPRDKIISMINTVINNYYEFMGYIEFANYVENIISLGETNEKKFTDKQRKLYEIQQIRRVFNDRMIVVDEVHNIRFTEENKKKRTGMKLLKIAHYSDNLRLLLLSATPMYNNYSEIIWLTNLLNINDKRAAITHKEVFTKNGDFIKQHITNKGKFVEGGRELLIRKLTGYVSFVRTENPYTFPFRIYPIDYSLDKNNFFGEGALKYPSKQLNGQLILEPIKNIQVYVSKISGFQEKGYKLILNTIVREKFVNEVFENMESFGYSLLQSPLEALNIVYPSVILDTDETNINTSALIQTKKIATSVIGRNGLSGIMDWYGKDREPIQPRRDFEYKEATIEKYGAIFSQENIHKYSHKISRICQIIKNGAKGIILIYSNYIDSGIVPMALALEEMGFSRFGTTPNTRDLFKQTQTQINDKIDYKMRSREYVEEIGETFLPANYVMITGDKSFSPANAEDLKYIVSPENNNGQRVKVVLISRTGSEGLDFKCIRQVHIMDSWYNMSRIDQIIGRGVRNLSHCFLPFEERNVEIYLHGTILETTPEEEAIDLYLYRSAEKKAKDIGRITRIMKECAVDCYLNIGQTNFTIDKMNKIAENQNVKITISTGREINFRIGDRPNTEICDYMNDCNFKCIGPPPDTETKDADIRTYNKDFMDMNKEVIMQRIRQLFREKSVYTRSKIISSININKKYPIIQIFSALTSFIQNENEYLIDYLGRFGKMINRGEYYLFQPIEITDDNATILERVMPVDYKRDKIRLEVSQKTSEDYIEELNIPSSVKYKNNLTETVVNAPEIENIMNSFYENMQTYETFNKEEKLKQKELNWYKHANLVTQQVHLIHKIPLEKIRDYVIEHMVDVYPNKLALLKYFFGGTENGFQENKATELEQKIHSYLQTKYVENKEYGLFGYLIDENDKWRIYLKTSQGFERAEEDDKKNLINKLKEFRYPYQLFHQYIGYISSIKEGDKELVFRIKNMSQTRGNKGFICRNSGKEDILKIINSIMGKTTYTNENTQGLLQSSFCCIIELIFRYNNDIDENKVWFLPPEEAFINDIYKRKM